MSRMPRALEATAAILLLGSFARAQSVLAPGTAVVATSDGFFVPDPASATPRLHLPATAFGLATLEAPAIEWERGTDSFLLATGARLFRVTVASLAPPQASVVDLTPASAQPLDLFDLDLNPATGELFLLDQSQDAVLRFSPPFAAGMAAASAIAVGATARAMALDSRSQPNAIDSAENGQVMRRPLDGSPPAIVAAITAGGVDHDARTAGKQGTFLVAKGANKVGRATGSINLLVDLNYSGLCAPLAMAPVDVEWSPLESRAFVLAEDGINPACGGGSGIVGSNHVVRFPLAQAAGVTPTLYTFAGGSGITGQGGDLAVVAGDFAFAVPYGTPCLPGGAGSTGPKLDLEGVLATTSTAATFTLAGAPPSRPVALIAGARPLAAALPTGCLLYVDPALVVVAGATDSAGALGVPFLLTPLPQGLDLYVQAAVAAPFGTSLSEGLAVHVGL